MPRTVPVSVLQVPHPGKSNPALSHASSGVTAPRGHRGAATAPGITPSRDSARNKRKWRASKNGLLRELLRNPQRPSPYVSLSGPGHTVTPTLTLSLSSHRSLVPGPPHTHTSQIPKSEDARVSPITWHRLGRAVSPPHAQTPNRGRQCTSLLGRNPFLPAACSPARAV